MKTCARCETQFDVTLLACPNCGLPETMTMKNPVKSAAYYAEIRALVDSAVKVLEKSETGRTVKTELLMLLKGRISNLDYDGWEAVSLILHAYRTEIPGTVLERLGDK